jgi:[acyl-carrier-protein] S-malonyltransferase
MGRDLYETFPASRRSFDAAERVLGFDLARLCFEGPEEELRKTHNTQPAIFVHSLAVLEALGWRLWGGEARLAGHSLGEYSAYVAAGAMKFEDALRAVRRRGELMYQAGIDRPGAMAAVLGLAPEVVERILERIDGIAVPANYNSPSQVVISGEVMAIEQASEALQEAGAKRVIRLDVSGAFHSPLMEGAARGLAAELAAIEIEAPAAEVVANESATPVPPADIRDSLGRQLLAPVRWEQTVRALIAWGAERFIELGPGKVLTGLVRAVDRSLPAEAIGTAEQILEASAARSEP